LVSVLAGHGNHLSTPLKYVETPCPRSKLSHLSVSGQLSCTLGQSLLPDRTLASSQLPPRPYKGLNSILSHSTLYLSLSLLLWTAIPSAIGLAPPSILSHSYTIPLSVFYFGLPTHLPLARFLAYRHSFRIGQPSPLDSYITSVPFALGTLIALMMEAARTSETSVDIQLITRQYIPEDSERYRPMVSTFVTCSRDSGVKQFSLLVTCDKCWESDLKWVTSTSFHILFSLSFTYHFTIRFYITQCEKPR
jgi:hypothetical protein